MRAMNTRHRDKSLKAYRDDQNFEFALSFTMTQYLATTLRTTQMGRDGSVNSVLDKLSRLFSKVADAPGRANQHY
jgi:hypothetical protein